MMSKTVSDSCRVSFLVAGVQKAGTSALFEYLREVPGLQLPAIKEAHFFDDETQDWAAPEVARYHALFELDGRLWGEATPILFYWPQALSRVHAYNPSMKLIILVRDPVERAWSHWKMEYAKGKEAEPFAWCIRDGRARMASAQPVPGFHRVFSYVERGFYGRQAARALSLFPRGQILFLASQMVKETPDIALAQVCDFLGVPRLSQPVERKSVRVASDIPYPSELTAADVTFLKRLYGTEMRRFTQLTGMDIFPAYDV